jgi:hypothetical protein
VKLAVVAETMQPGMSISYVYPPPRAVAEPGVLLEATDEQFELSALNMS